MPSRNSPGNGPGRGTSRSRAVPPSRTPRTPGRAGERAARPSRLTNEAPAPTSGGGATAATPLLRRGVGLTRRAIALAVIMAMLMLSYASSLRVYLRQEQDAATARQQIAERDAAIASLQDEVERWKDDDYVKAQARDRLGWVMPGEVGFRVIGADGKPLGGGATISGVGTLPSGEHATTWWERLEGSLSAADEPVAAQSADPTPITAPSSADPSASVSPSAASSAGSASATPTSSPTR